MFKRPRLSTPFALVNAPCALAVLFFCAACSGPETLGSDQTNPAVSAAPAPQPLSFPAVWNTAALEGPLTSVGLAGAWGSRIAVTYASGDLQFFDFDGERLTDPIPLDVGSIGNGAFVDLSGTGVTVFPGVQTKGDLRLYIHAGDLDSPVVFDVDFSPDAPVLGLCSAAIAAPDFGLMHIAYWTEANPRRLQTGRLIESGDTLAFVPEEIITSDHAVTTCLINADGADIFSVPVRAASALERHGERFVLTLDSSGNLEEVDAEGDRRPIMVRDGLSVDMPALPVDMAGTGDARTGGYPGGLVVMIGEIRQGEFRAILIDPSALTLARLPDGFR